MERFLLENVARYQRMVQTFRPPPVPQTAKVDIGTPSPNMVVSARIRPLLDEDVAAGFPCAVFQRPCQTSVVDIHDLYNHPRGRPLLKSFTFEVDRLFNSQTTTEEIYETLVVDLVPFAWNGGIGTLLSYGQTGSGKTFTVNRLEQLVAESLMDGSLKGRRQVYITIIDLAGNSASDLLNSRKPISLLEDSFGVTQLAGAHEHLVQDRDEVMELIERAASFRRTATTLRNDASSRSHAICRIRIHNPATNSDGLLYLIDLAGSEAARDVVEHGADRMRETRGINMSLSVLKDCIRGKAQADLLGPKSKKKPHVPFRQSALTKVLKHVFDPAVQRACKTVVIACVNPSLADVGPSKNTLRYAETLRILVPTTNKMEPNTLASASASTPTNPTSESTEPDTMLSRLGLRGRWSSRDLEDPTAAAIPFKERIRPGMVVSWNQPPDLGLAPSLPSTPDDLRLAVVLCPVEAVPGTVKDALGNVVNPTESEHADTKDKGPDRGARYLCALVTPGAMAKAYAVNLWQQVVVDVSMMEEEVFLEYDAGTRNYYVSG